MSANLFRILCVDDDPISLAQLEQTLAAVNSGFIVRGFVSPRDALAAHLERPADIVVSDLRMGNPNGIELIGQMSAAAPDSIYILLSGDIDLEAALAAVNTVKVFRFLVKPADADLLRLTLEAAKAELNLRRLQRISELSHSAVRQLRTGVAYIDEQHHIIFSNQEAQMIFRESGVFECSWDGSLRASTAAETRRFYAFLETLRASGENEADGAVFRFSPPGAARPVIASIRHHRGQGDSGGSFSLVLCDTKRARANEHMIAAALNLTQSEAKIVRGLADGLSVDEAAGEAGVSISTARTYLKNVFFKTGVNRQSELVRLVMLTAA